MSTLNIFKANGLTSPFGTPDTGAYTLYGGTAGGNILTFLDELLCLKRCYEYTGATGTGVDGSFNTDNSTEARLQGGTPFNVFVTPGANDAMYFGLQRTFSNLKIVLGTLGILSGGTMVWEYYNGSVWATLVGASDGTSQLTANGTLSFAAASQTGWATKAINSITAYWIRARCTGAYGTYPTINWCTITGWSRTWSGTNVACYQGSGGNLPNVVVQDDGFTWNTGTPSTATYKEALCRGYGTVTVGSDPRASGSTDPYPTVSGGTQPLAQGIILRKSSLADATTARAYLLAADDRTLHLFIATGDVSNSSNWYAFSFGQGYSLQAGDLYDQYIMGGYAANTPGSNEFGLAQLLSKNAVNGQYMQRSYSGASPAIVFNKHGDPGKDASSLTPFGMQGSIPVPNGPDQAIYLSPVWLGEGATFTALHFRGQLRGLWECLHQPADQDTIQGSGSLAGKAFLCLKQVDNPAALAVTFAVETSDTWQTN
jgi:hypothetical protein